MPCSPAPSPVTCKARRAHGRVSRVPLALFEDLVHLARRALPARGLAIDEHFPVAVAESYSDPRDRQPESHSYKEARHTPCPACASLHERAEDIGKDSQLRLAVFARLHVRTLADAARPLHAYARAHYHPGGA